MTIQLRTGLMKYGVRHNLDLVVFQKQRYEMISTEIDEELEKHTIKGYFRTIYLLNP